MRRRLDWTRPPGWAGWGACFLLGVVTSMGWSDPSTANPIQTSSQSDSGPRGPSIGHSAGLLDAVTRPTVGRTRRVSSANPDLSKNGDARTIRPGETLVLADLKGPGILTHFWNTVGSKDPFIGRSLVLRIYWDGAESPSVVAPLGDFFGVGHGGPEDFQSLPVAVSSFGRARSCFWRMPFRERAKVTLTLEESRYGSATFYYYLDWEEVPDLPADSLYFHARYHQAMPAPPGDYTLLETEGRGHYVGTVYSAHQVRLGWFGEGDDRFWIDGEEYPSLSGTGTEDYFGDAWGFRRFATPFFGVSVWEGVWPGDRVTAYRWHLANPVRFERSLKVTIEHHGSLFTDLGVQTASFAERPDWLSSVAFWYQTPAVGWGQPLPPSQDRLAPYRVLPARDLKLSARPALMLTRQATEVIYAPGKGDGELDLEFEVQEKGRYQLSAVLLHTVMGGKYQAKIDGKEIGPELDLGGTGHDWAWRRLDLCDLAPGRHTLTFVGKGASPQMRSLGPKLYGLGIYYLILLRLEDMEGYR